MKKTKLFTLLFMLMAFFTLSIGLSANAASVLMDEGASIRTEGNQGLRYTATLSGNYDNGEHGFYLIYGKASKDDLIIAKNNDDPLINGKDYKTVYVSGYTINKKFSVVLIGIPEVGYEDDITVLAFIKQNGKEILSENVTTRCVAEVARNIYINQPDSYQGKHKATIDSIALLRKIKVIHSDGSISYYGDFDDVDFTLNPYDKVELARGLYKAPLVVDQDNVSVYSLNKDININSNGQRPKALYEEAVYTGTDGITLNEGVKNFSVNGLTFSGNRGLHLMGNNKDIIVENNLFTVFGNYIIRDKSYDSSLDANKTLSNIRINNNYFNSSANWSRDIYFQGFVSSLKVHNNYFNSHLDTYTSNDYGVRLMRYTNDSKVDIYNNKFNKLGSPHLIEVGLRMGSSNEPTYNNALNLNIENNYFTPNNKTALLGNAMRILYIGDNSTISIVGNSSIRTSTYFNAIMLSGGSSASYSGKIDNVKVDILHNKFYAAELDEVTKPEARNESTKRYTRIGLGIPITSDVTIFNNYFSQSTSRYAYSFITSKSSSKGNNQTSLTQTKANTSSEATAGYNQLLNNFSDKIDNYSKSAPFSNVNSAHYFGLNERDIKKYLPNFNDEDINIIEIQEEKLVYVGRGQYLERIATNKGLPLKPLQGILRMEDIVVEIGNAFRNKGNFIQYDQNPGRRMLGGKPELATEERDYYSDCSAFVADVYNIGFNVPLYPGMTQTTTNTKSIADYARNNKNNPVVIAHVLTSDFKTATEQQKELDRIYNLMIPGDVIVHRSATGGHALLYIGNNRILHVTGKSYDYDNKEEQFETNNGAVWRINTAMFKDSTSTRYLFREKNIEFCILRPLNNPSAILTDDGKSRNMVKSLDFTKSATKGNYSSVIIGEEITYSLTVKNNSSVDLFDFYVKDIYKSDYESFVSFGPSGSRDGTTISFHVDELKAGESKTYNYTTKIKKPPIGEYQFTSTGGYVFSLRSNPLYFTILEWSEYEMNKLEERMNNAKGTTRNLRELLTYIYGANHPVIEGTMSAVYEKSDLRPRHLWGGRIYDRQAKWNTHYRVRLLKESYLTPGDIIVVKEDSSVRIYFYTGTELLRYNNNNTYAVSLATTLEKVTGYDYFRVIRPTIYKQ